MICFSIGLSLFFLISLEPAYKTRNTLLIAFDLIIDINIINHQHKKYNSDVCHEIKSIKQLWWTLLLFFSSHFSCLYLFTVFCLFWRNHSRKTITVHFYLINRDLENDEKRSSSQKEHLSDRFLLNQRITEDENHVSAEWTRKDWGRHLPHFSHLIKSHQQFFFSTTTSSTGVNMRIKSGLPLDYCSSCFSNIFNIRIMLKMIWF